MTDANKKKQVHEKPRSMLRQLKCTTLLACLSLFPLTWSQSLAETGGEFKTSPASDSNLRANLSSETVNRTGELNEQSRPFIPGWQLEPSPSRILPNRQNSTGFSLAEREAMTKELVGLIDRFETTLLTADAKASDIESSTKNLVQQLVTQNLTKSDTSKLAFTSYPKAHQALARAKQQFQQFETLTQQGRFSQARKRWLEARNTLWSSYPTNRQVASSEIRAIWLDRGTIVKARSEKDLVDLFDRLATAGINTVFFETLNSGYTIHPSRIAPEQNPLVRGWDPLRVAVKLAHERNMELHAWVWTFATVNQRHNTIVNLPQEHLGPVLSRYPEWALTDKKGNKFHYTSKKAFLDPANPGVQRYLTLLLEEIATEYGVDGIHLDYIRYPFQSPTAEHTYGYGTAARQKFKELTGVDPVELTVGDRLWNQWTGFRMQQVSDFVASASMKLKQQRPDLVLSTAVFPMPRQERLNKIQQYWEEWVREGWIDMLVPMTYATDSEQLKTLTRPLLEAFDEGNALLLPGIRLLNVPDIVAVDQMQLLRGLTAEGYALFAAENFRPSLAEIFNRTQGRDVTPVEAYPLPHREPFRATQARYQSLKKEWNYLIRNQQIGMNPRMLRDWAIEADNLSSVFTELVADSSLDNFLQAQKSLNNFRRKFPRWMKDSQTINTYQTEVWQNRLETLDRLLSYGESRLSHTDPLPTK